MCSIESAGAKTSILITVSLAERVLQALYKNIIGYLLQYHGLKSDSCPGVFFIGGSDKCILQCSTNTYNEAVGRIWVTCMYIQGCTNKAKLK